MRFPDIFNEIVEGLATMVELRIGKQGEAFTHLVGIEAKGFVIGPLLAMRWQVPFVPIRQRGKLPGECYYSTYTVETKPRTLEIRKNAFHGKPAKVLLIDDFLASGRTLRSAE